MCIQFLTEIQAMLLPWNIKPRTPPLPHPMPPKRLEAILDLILSVVLELMQAVSTVEQLGNWSCDPLKFNIYVKGNLSRKDSVRRVSSFQEACRLFKTTVREAQMLGRLQISKGTGRQVWKDPRGVKWQTIKGPLISSFSSYFFVLSSFSQ